MAPRESRESVVCTTTCLFVLGGWVGGWVGGWRKGEAFGGTQRVQGVSGLHHHLFCIG